MIKVITRNAKGHINDFPSESILEFNSFTESQYLDAKPLKSLTCFQGPSVGVDEALNTGLVWKRSVYIGIFPILGGCSGKKHCRYP